MKLIEIANLIGIDPTSISKEIKRNRIVSEDWNLKSNFDDCVKTNRFPLCCNVCPLRYKPCGHVKWIYVAKIANDKYESKKISSRAGIDMDDESFNYLNKTIEERNKRGDSIYQILKTDSNIKVSVPTVYRYIDKGLLSTKKAHLPFAPRMKKRKASKDYDYRENKGVSRDERTYLDYLAYRRNNSNLYHIEMDFLGSIKKDRKAILTLVIKALHFPILFLVEDKNAAKVVDIFNRLEEGLGIEVFKRVMGFILTDRDPSFSDYLNIEFSHISAEERCRIFYADPYVSNQKGSVENMNKQLRKFFPKGKSIDNLTQLDVFTFNKTMWDTHVKSLGGYTPYEAFVEVYSELTFNNLVKVLKEYK